MRRDVSSTPKLGPAVGVENVSLPVPRLPVHDTPPVGVNRLTLFVLAKKNKVFALGLMPGAREPAPNSPSVVPAVMLRRPLAVATTSPPDSCNFTVTVAFASVLINKKANPIMFRLYEAKRQKLIFTFITRLY
jgi:hypothetical protein